jgi:1,4-alpha-glucan branching enzyme
MNILFITGEFPPYILGGLGTYVSDVTFQLEKNGHTVDVLVLQGDISSYNKVKKTGGSTKITRINFSPKQFEKLINKLVNKEKIIDDFNLTEFTKKHYDVIHAHDWYGALWGAALKYSTNTPLIFTSHLPTRAGFTYTGHSIEIKRKMQLESLALRAADAVVAPSNNVADTLVHEYNIPPSSIEVISNGVYTDIFHPISSKQKPSNIYHLVSAARLTEQKGMTYLLDVVKQLTDQGFPISLDVAGTGPMLSQLQKEVKRLGINKNVTFLGFMEKTALSRLFQKADLFINTSIYEPFGLVVIESMACGLPVISFSQGGIKEIIHHQKDGILVPPADTKTMTAEIIKCLRNERSLRRMRKLARTTATLYDWQRIVKKLEKMYTSIYQQHTT